VEGGVWLPVDMHYRISADLLGMESDSFKGTMHMTDCQIDIPLSDSLFFNQTTSLRIRIDRDGPQGTVSFCPIRCKRCLRRKNYGFMRNWGWNK
jgi:hypothetical protein